MRWRTVRDNCDSLVFFIELKPISTKDPKEFAMTTLPNNYKFSIDSVSSTKEKLSSCQF